MHLIQQLRKHDCGDPACRKGESATRLMRCRRGRCVIARCPTHGPNMERVRELHEATCAASP